MKHFVFAILLVAVMVCAFMLLTVPGADVLNTVSRIAKMEQEYIQRTRVDVSASDIVYSRHMMRPFHAASIAMESHKLIFFTQRKVECNVWASLFRRMMSLSTWRNSDPEFHDKYNGQKYLY
jgi:hypothetical protein